jgi:hypothetical protein
MMHITEETDYLGGSTPMQKGIPCSIPINRVIRLGYVNETDMKLLVLDDMLIDDTTKNKYGISTSPVPSKTVLNFQ